MFTNHNLESPLALILCAVLLGGLFLVCIFPFLNGSLKQRLHLPTPKLSLSELVKIYLNPRTVLRAIGYGMKKLHRMLKGWECVPKSRTVFRLVNNHSATNSVSGGVGNNKLSAGSWRNLLRVGRRKNEGMCEIWMPKMNPNLPDEQRHILSVVSDEYIDGSWITIYACLKSEWKPRADYIQTEADEILNPRYTCTHNGDDTHKSKDVAKPNERGQR
jgi:hypothetical protein